VGCSYRLAFEPSLSSTRAGDRLRFSRERPIFADGVSGRRAKVLGGTGCPARGLHSQDEPMFIHVPASTARVGESFCATASRVEMYDTVTNNALGSR